MLETNADDHTSAKFRDVNGRREENAIPWG